MPLKAILPRDKLIAFSPDREGDGTKFFAEAEREDLEGVIAKRSEPDRPNDPVEEPLMVFGEEK